MGRIRTLTNRLSSDERQPAVVLKLVPANGMVFEIIESAKLVRNEVEAEDSILKLLVVVNVGTLVTAARKDGVE